ncbi:hypothetical protein BpHYR1_033671, partial [Brachionus plicatilis]
TCDIISKKKISKGENLEKLNLENYNLKNIDKLEQSNMEADLIQVLSGETISSQSRIQKKRIVVSNN